MDKRILVTGATGYIASRLVPRLLEAGYRVRCLARDPRRLAGRRWAQQVEIVQGDVTISSTLQPALQGVHTAYYLIHNMTRGHGYTELELESARVFALAAAEAGVEHIIYLGGLADPEQPIAAHMRSRIETGRVLREGRVPVTEFRAGVIAGSGSISFEMIRFMTELLPVVPGPLWMRNRSQPIAMQNVIDYLMAALTNSRGRGGVYEIGGPDVATYGELMLRYARLRGLKRRMFLIPGLPVWFMAFGVGLMTPVPYPIAHALIGGLSADSVVKYPQALQHFPEVKLIDFDSATMDALEKTHPSAIERVWDVGNDFAAISGQTSEVRRALKHEGCFVEYRNVRVRAASEKILDVLTKMAGESKGFIESTQIGNRLRVRRAAQWAGEKWIEWTVHPDEACTVLTQTVFFCPRGVPGFLYWLLLYPFHVLQFRGFIRRVLEQSQTR